MGTTRTRTRLGSLVVSAALLLTGCAQVTHNGSQRAVLAAHNAPHKQAHHTKAHHTKTHQTKIHRKAKLAAPRRKRLVSVAMVIDNGYRMQHIGLNTKSHRLHRGIYRVKVKGVRCKPHRPTAVVTPFGNGGHAHVLKVACASRTARITVRRAGVRHRPHNGGFYISVYRGKGVSHAKSPVARSRNIATGDLGRKAKLSRVTSQYKLRARRFGRGRFQVTVHALNPGCTRNAPMVMLTLHGHGARSAMGAAVDCKSGSTSLVFDTYNESGRFRNRGLSFAIFRSQTVAATSNPLHARCASRLTPGKRCY